MNIEKAIKDHLEIKFTYVDLFYAFCAAKGIDDPENDVETDEEYDALEKEFESKIKYNDICNLGAAIVADGMERINYTMANIEKRQ